MFPIHEKSFENSVFTWKLYVRMCLWSCTGAYENDLSKHLMLWINLMCLYLILKKESSRNASCIFFTVVTFIDWCYIWFFYCFTLGIVDILKSICIYHQAIQHGIYIIAMIIGVRNKQNLIDILGSKGWGLLGLWLVSILNFISMVAKHCFWYLFMFMWFIKRCCRCFLILGRF